MINNAPKSWTYSDNLEMLFFFYQCADELLSENTCDTYSLPVHNTITLSYEIEYTYKLLQRYNLVEEYYSKYIPMIIDELISSIEEDHIIKAQLGYRLPSIKTGFVEAKTNHVLLQRWLSLFRQACNDTRYVVLYQDEIIRLVLETKNKNQLYKYTKSVFTSLLNNGLSREYLFYITRGFFNSDKQPINSPEQIRDFFHLFNLPTKEVKFLILMDIDIIEYLGQLSDRLRLARTLNKIDVESEREKIASDPRGRYLISEYERISKKEREYQSISIVRYSLVTPDPYLAIEALEDSLVFLQSFSRYYKHYFPKKQIFRILIQNDDGTLNDFQLPNKLRKRPYVEQEIINKRLTCIFKSDELSIEAFNTISSAFQMHSEALDSKNEITMLRNFWTSLETLFSNPVVGEVRDNVIQSTLSIIQKTYVLKILRTLYHQISDAIDQSTLELISISNFGLFVRYFASNTEDSIEMKEIYKCLGNNPLLRSRIYDIRKKLGSGKKILDLLNSHQQKIEWQLERIYRARNIATHIGDELPNTRQIVDNLHAYFDYIINFIICKIENEDYINNISALVFESKNDNMIHQELLKKGGDLSLDNYTIYLFGPDEKIINYSFEY